MENAYDPTVFIFDAYPGGIGFSDILFERHDELIRAARSLIVHVPVRPRVPHVRGSDPRGGTVGQGMQPCSILDLMEKS